MQRERTKRPPLPTLTGMRWVAAFLVFIYHAGTRHAFLNSEVDNSFASVTSKAGWTGVSFFFVLSGFVLMWSARPGDSLPAFWRRRVAKIYPNHVVTWVAALALILWSGSLLGPVSWPAAFANLLLVHAWVPDPDYFTSINGVTWSLSCEVLFYLMFPLWLVLVRRIAPYRLWCWAGGIIILIFCMPFLAELLPAKPLLPWKKPLPVYRYWFVYIFPPVRMLEFILGMVMARAVEEDRRWVKVGMVQAGILCCVGYAAALYAPSSEAFVAYVGHDIAFLLGIAAMTVLPIALVIAAGAQADLRGEQSLFRHRAMLWLGEISFAFYLVHRLVLVYGHQALGTHRQWPTAAAVGLIIVALAISIGLAVLLYKIVEVPMMRRFSGSRRQRDAARPNGSLLSSQG